VPTNVKDDVPREVRDIHHDVRPIHQTPRRKYFFDDFSPPPNSKDHTGPLTASRNTLSQNPPRINAHDRNNLVASHLVSIKGLSCYQSDIPTFSTAAASQSTTGPLGGDHFPVASATDTSAKPVEPPSTSASSSDALPAVEDLKFPTTRRPKRRQLSDAPIWILEQWFCDSEIELGPGIPDEKCRIKVICSSKTRIARADR
jgi:hypothetical protein